MFSGIISEIGIVASLVLDGEQVELGIKAAMFSGPELPTIGASIAVSGVCLTVTRLESGVAYFALASETLRRSALGTMQTNSKVNLERSLRLGDRLDGHLVLGHVDATAEILDRTQEANTVCFQVTSPHEIAALIATKGSITIDGVSLTVGEVTNDAFFVYVIPHTLKETTMHEYQPGRKVNVEADCIARYVQRLHSGYIPGGNA